MEHKIKVDEKDHALDGQNKMNSFQKEKKHCDFIIKVESEEISVHRNVICSRSDYFDAMFSHDTKEKRTGVVEIKGVDRECTVKCVDFMYTGETSIEEDQCGELLRVATLFQLLSLCNAIAAILEEKLDLKSFFATKQLADLYSCQKLEDACNNFALKHFQEIAQLEEFNQLDKQSIEFLPGPSSSEAVVSSSAESLKLIGMSATKSMDDTPVDTNVRPIEDATQQKDMNVCSTDNEAMQQKAPIVLSATKSMDGTPVDTTIFPIEDATQQKDMAVCSTDETMQQKGIAVFDKLSSRMQILSMNKKTWFWQKRTWTWTPKQVLNFDMMYSEFSAVVFKEHLYVFLNNKNVYRIVHSDSDATWEQMASKKTDYGPVVVLNGMFYALDYDCYNDHMEQFDPSQNEWQLLPYKKLVVLCAALAVAEENIFVIGGLRASVEMGKNWQMVMNAEVEKFDPTTSSWSLDVPMKKERYRSSAVTVGDRIYVLGGFGECYEGISDVEYRCPRSKTWILIPSMKNTRQFFSSCCIGGKIYAIGDECSNPQTIEEFDLEKNRWKVVCKMDGIYLRLLASVALPL